MLNSREDDLLRDDSDDILQRLYKLIPSQTQDVIAMAIFLVFLPIAYIFEIFSVIGDVYAPWGSEWSLRVGILSFFFVNCYINYFYMVRIGPNGRNAILPNVVQAGFRYCHSCHAQAPPRAYHCPVCDSCAFRRDHHCSFGAVCVGHFNQRYFCAAVTNLWIVTLVMVTYNWPWMLARMSPSFSVASFWQLFLPHLAFMLRFISLFQFCCILVFCFSVVVALFVTYLVAAQVYCIWRGQSRVEYLLDVHAYQLGFLNNLRQCLGSNWPLTLLVPFAPSPLPSSNGMHFETRDMQKHHDAKSL